MRFKPFQVTECLFCAAQEGESHSEGCPILLVPNLGALDPGRVYSNNVSFLKNEVKHWKSTASYLASQKGERMSEDQDNSEELSSEHTVAGMTGEDGLEIPRDDLELDQMLDDANNQDRTMEDELG